MKWRVLVSAPYMLPVLEEYRPVFALHGVEVIAPPVRERLEEEELLRWIGDVDGVICGDDRFTERVLASAPRLKVICKWGTGIDSIDADAARRRGIPVRNTLDAFTEPVADSVMGYILSFARRHHEMNADMHAGRWVKIPAVSLGECTLGVIGVGRIGRTVMRRAKAFGMRLLGHDIAAIPGEFARETGMTPVSKEDLLREADFVSLNCDLNPSSFHVIQERELRLMKRGAFLINTARGPLVKEKDLARALEEKWIAGAALDVFEDEPLPGDSPLLRMENVLLAPHNANSSPRAHRRVHENTIRALLAGLGIAQEPEFKPGAWGDSESIVVPAHRDA